MAFFFARKKNHYFPVYFESETIFIEEDESEVENLFDVREKIHLLQQQGYQIIRYEENKKYKKNPKQLKCLNRANSIEDLDLDSFSKDRISIKSNHKLRAFIKKSLQEKLVFDVKKVKEKPRKKPFFNFLIDFANMSFIPETLFKLGMKRIAAPITGKFILKSQRMDFLDRNSQNLLRKQTPDQRKQTFINDNKDKISINLLKVITPENAELDTIELSPKDLVEDNKKNALHIVHFVGYDMCYEEILKDMKREVTKLKEENINAVSIGFNYPHVVNSKGRVRSKDDLVKAGIAQVQRLIDDGVAPENIMIHAYSLGGGIGSLVAKHFHNQNKKMYIFHNRSFAKLSSTAAKWAPKWLHSIARPVLRWFFSPVNTNWEVNAASAYLQIDPRYKRHIVANGDRTIAESTSMAHTLEQDLSQKLDDQSINQDDLNKLNQLYKKSRMSVTEGDKRNPHSVPMQQIKNQKGVTGEMFFLKFCKKAVVREESRNRNEETQENSSLVRVGSPIIKSI